MGKKILMLFVCTMLSASMAWAQTRTVTGTVVDSETGEPIPGAQVKVQGTSLGAVADSKGVFVLKNLPKDAKNVIVSFMGMKTADVALRDGMKVILIPDTKAMDEVMVVAYGTQTKSSFTGSATVLDAKDLQKHTVTDVSTALVGSVPGLQMRGSSGAPGSQAGSMNIRGLSSLYASTEPLIILDGSPYPASLSNLNPDDIESVTVLKDASSAALYGARGANGVILITTKKGKNREAEVSFDVKWGMNTRSIQDYDVITDPAKYYEVYCGQLYNNYYYNQGMSQQAAWDAANRKMLSDLQYNIYSGYEGNLIGNDGKINPNAVIGNKYTATNGKTYYLQNDNWQDEAYRTGFRHQYDVNVKGAHDKGDYYVSVGYLGEDGFIKYSDFERITARIKSNYLAKKWLRLGANIGYVNTTNTANSNRSDTDLGATNMSYYTSNIAPIYPVYVRTVDANGNPVIMTDSYGHQAYDYGTLTYTDAGKILYNGYGGLTRPFLNTGNPLGANRYNETVSKGNQLNGTFTVDINFCRFLKFNATSTLTWGHTNYSNLANAYEGNKAGVNGEITKSQTDNLRTNNIQTLTYFDTFGNHDINVMLGHEYYNAKTTYLGAAAQGLYDGSQIPEINAAANNQYKSNSYTSRYNVEGIFANVLYNYDQKYFASASYRRDASSRFDTDHRWGNFWSLGAAWLMNKENFLSKAKWIDELKLKVSVGQQGNDGLNSSFYYANLYTLDASGTYTMAPSFAQLGNKNITWETTTNWNVGVEFRLFKGRLSGGIDFYNKFTKDQLFWLSIPGSMGTRGYYGNLGDVRNRGVELSVNGVAIRSRKVEWNIYANLSHNSNTVVSIPESKMIDPENGYRGYTEDHKWIAEGTSMYTAFYPKYAGTNDKGEALYWIDDDLNGKTDRPGKNLSRTTTVYEDASYYNCGDMLPAVFGGFGTTLTAGGFDISMTFDYQIGGKVFDSRYQSLVGPTETAAGAGSNFHMDVLNAWTTTNTTTNMPRFYYGDKYANASSDRFLTSAGYLNFQSFTVGYTLPQKYAQKLMVKKLRVYCSGENLAFISARKGLDPRYSYSGYGRDANGNVKSVVNNTYSPSRTVMWGLQVSF